MSNAEHAAEGSSEEENDQALGDFLSKPVVVDIDSLPELRPVPPLQTDFLIGECTKRRYFAMCMDDVFALILMVSVASNLPRTQSDTQSLWIGLSVYCIYFAYYFLLESFFSRTIGKWFFGLKVVRTDGSRPKMWQCAVRTFLRVFEVNPCFGGLLGGLVILLTSSHRRIGDFAGGTVVVATS